MPEINSLFYKYDNLKVVKPRKDNDRRELIAKLSEATGRTTKSIHFSTIHFPTSWLRDALSYCLHYSNPKMRNKMFGEFINNTKI